MSPSPRRTAVASIRYRPTACRPRCRGRCPISPVTLEDFAEALAKNGYGRRRRAGTRAPAANGFRYRVEGTLAIDVEGLDALHFIAEQVEPVR